jgi:hypothetical protein
MRALCTPVTGQTCGIAAVVAAALSHDLAVWHDVRMALQAAVVG